MGFPKKKLTIKTFNKLTVLILKWYLLIVLGQIIFLTTDNYHTIENLSAIFKFICFVLNISYHEYSTS